MLPASLFRVFAPWWLPLNWEPGSDWSFASKGAFCPLLGTAWGPPGCLELPPQGTEGMLAAYLSRCSLRSRTPQLKTAWSLQAFPSKGATCPLAQDSRNCSRIAAWGWHRVRVEWNLRAGVGWLALGVKTAGGTPDLR